MSNTPQNGKYHVHIGLEIHSQMNTAQKIFCSCPTGFDAEPNRNVCPICLGYPGVLPRLNTQAMEKAYLVALALDSAPTTHTAFERKNYFYPDLPKNYQISQFAEPLGRGGRVDFFCGGEARSIEFIEIHLEEDAGKMVHSGDCTLIDFNRTGTPLLEMVTKPQLRSGSEAESLLLLMRKIVRYLGVSDGNMEEGSLRCDANISLSPDGNLPDYKVELKNMNSARFVRLALEHEIARQTKLLDAGQRPTQETRLWNENRDVTIAMRSKEVAMDYRYFPEPDLPHFIASPEFLEKVKAQLVELPLERERRFCTQYKLTPQLAEQMTADIQTADYFEGVLENSALSPTQAAQWISGDLRRELRHRKLSISTSPIAPERLRDLLLLLHDGAIHGKIAKQLLPMLFERSQSAAELVAELGLSSVRGADLQTVVETVIADNPQALADIAQGKNQGYGFLMGKVMGATNGQAEPQEAQQLLHTLIGEKQKST